MSHSSIKVSPTFSLAFSSLAFGYGCSAPSKSLPPPCISVSMSQCCSKSRVPIPSPFKPLDPPHPTLSHPNGQHTVFRVPGVLFPSCPNVMYNHHAIVRILSSCLHAYVIHIHPHTHLVTILVISHPLAFVSRLFLTASSKYYLHSLATPHLASFACFIHSILCIYLFNFGSPA